MFIAPRLLAVTWLMAGSGSAGDPVPLRIDAEFDPPAGFAPSTVRAPALYEGARNDAGHDVRLIVYALPAAADADEGELRYAADLVAERFLSTWQSNSREYPTDDVLVLATNSAHARLAIISAAGRHFGLLLYSDRDVDPLMPEIITSAQSIRRSSAAYPVAPGIAFQARQDGFAIDLPFAFEVQPVEPPAVLQAAPPAHWGHFALLSVDRLTDGLDLPLADAAAAMAGELAGAFPDADKPHAARVGTFDGYALELGSADHRGVAALIDLARYRVRVTWLVDAALYDLLRPVFERSLASLTAIDRHYDAGLEDVYRDSEHGFSLRPPAGFNRLSHSDGLVTFEQHEARPPRARLEVHLVDAVEARAADACGRAAAAIAARQGGTATVGQRIVNGRPVATTTITSTRDAGLIEQHVVYACDQQVLDLVLIAPVDEALLLRAQLDACLVTFRCEPRRQAPELGERIHDDSSAVSLRPPSDWTIARTATTITCLEPAADAERAEIVAGTRSFPDDPDLPIEQRLAGRPTRMIKALIADMHDQGLSLIRVEDAITGGSLSQFQLAYNSAGQPMRALVVIQDAQPQFRFARGSAPGGRFAELRSLLEASLATLDHAQTP